MSYEWSQLKLMLRYTLSERTPLIIITNEEHQDILGNNEDSNRGTYLSRDTAVFSLLLSHYYSAGHLVHCLLSKKQKSCSRLDLFFDLGGGGVHYYTPRTYHRFPLHDLDRSGQIGSWCVCRVAGWELRTWSKTCSLGCIWTMQTLHKIIYILTAGKSEDLDDVNICRDSLSVGQGCIALNYSDYEFGKPPVVHQHPSCCFFCISALFCENFTHIPCCRAYISK